MRSCVGFNHQYRSVINPPFTCGRFPRFFSAPSAATTKPDDWNETKKMGSIDKSLEQRYTWNIYIYFKKEKSPLSFRFGHEVDVDHSLQRGERRCGDRILERRGRGEREEKVRIVWLQVIVSKVKHSHNRYYVSSVPLEVAVYSDFTTAGWNTRHEWFDIINMSVNHGVRWFFFFFVLLHRMWRILDFWIHNDWLTFNH